jgi:hypothetical protein
MNIGQDHQPMDTDQGSFSASTIAWVYTQLGFMLQPVADLHSISESESQHGVTS